MKKVVAYFFFAFIGLAVLSTSVGITIGKMVCPKGCEAMISLGKMEDCCGRDSEHESSVESDCCKISNTQIKADTHIFSKKINPPAVKEIRLPKSENAENYVTLFPSFLLSFDTSDIPTKPSGKPLLVIISRFTI